MGCAASCHGARNLELGARREESNEEMVVPECSSLFRGGKKQSVCVLVSDFGVGAGEI